MADTERKERIHKFYEAFKKKDEYVAQICGDQPPQDPLQIIPQDGNNTFLHMASRFKQKDLVNELLKMLPKEGKDLLSEKKNIEGNTILHEVATSDTMEDVAKNLVDGYKKKDPKLLTARNELGETPIFCAARYGQTEMFKFLAKEMSLEKGSEEDVKQHLQRADGTTALHISIFIECFELAKFIADNYSCLIKEKDGDLMTALQYVACNPIAFGKKKMKITQGLEEFWSSSDSKISIREKIKRMLNVGSKTSDERSFQRLVESLVDKDTSWHASINFQAVEICGTKDLETQQSFELSQKKDSEIQQSFELSQQKDEQESQKKRGKIFKQKSKEKKVQNSQENEGQDYEEDGGTNSTKYKKSDETPLFLATISNNKDIVEKILKRHPQELKHTNKKGENILQVAILYHHIEIFDMVVKFEVLARSLLSATDKKGNSLLHMVGLKRKSKVSEKMQNPALQLRKELWFFQKVKLACKMHLTKPLNGDHQTAEELFATKNEKLHGRAKEWLMRATENCTILSIFIATVAFAAAYTVPGGSDGSTGIPILHSKPFFVVFIIADVISLTFALTSVGIFLSILTSSFPLQHFEKYLFKKLTQGIICMVLSISMMAVAFGATIILIMTHNQKNVVWHVVAFLPVPIFFFSYSPLRSTVLGRCIESFKKYLMPVAIVIAIFLLLLVYLLWEACDYIICKPLCWIRRNKSQSKSNAKSPQPTAVPLPQV